MKDIIYEFLDYLTLEKRYSIHTETNYEIDLFKYAEYIQANNKNYLKLKYQDISAYIIFLKKSGYKPASINRSLSSLRSFYNYLIMKKKVSANPLNLVKSVKLEKKLPNYFKYDDFLAMVSSISGDSSLDKRNILILELLLATGLRVSELANIKIQDININDHELKAYGKGKKERMAFFGNTAEEKLKEYLNHSRLVLLNGKMNDYLFINHIGEKLTDRGIRLIIDNIIKSSATSAKVSPHTFRHSFATMLLNNGCNIKSVQELLGHASINTTSIYTHLSNEEVRKAYLSAHPRAKK